MNSFIENVNYVANLDNKYGRSVEIFKNNLSLRTESYSVAIKFTYYNNETKELVDIFGNYNAVDIAGFNAMLINFKSQIINSIDGNTFTCDASFTYTDFIINNVGIVNLKINSSDDNIKTYGLNISISSGLSEVYNINGSVSDTLKILPSLAFINDEVINNLSIIADNVLNIETIIDNIDNIAKIGLVSDNINDVATVADNIADVVTVGDNIASVNTTSNSIVKVGIVSDSIADVGIVADNVVNVNAVGTDIANVNSVAANETNINAVVSDVIPMMSEILLADDRAASALASANSADVSEALAHKWAQEQEDVVVTGTIGVDDEYSAYHWAKKAEAAIGGSITLDSLYDIDTTGIVNGGMIRYNTATSTWNSYDFTNNDVIGLDITANITVGVGQIAWNATEGTADLGLPGGSTLQIGQENTRTVRNGTGSTIMNGTVCMFAGTVGNSGRIKVAPYTGINGTHKYIYGVATQTITSGSDGLITIDGKVRGIDTTGSLVGEVWNDEDILYAKPNDSGRLTNVEPGDSELKIVVATVIHAHTSGTLEVRVLPIDENMSYTKEQSDSTFVPLVGDFTLDLGGL